MSVVWVGVLEDQPRRCTSGETRMTLAAAAQLFTVLVSGGHARWVPSIDPGTLVEVVGELAGPGLVHATWVWPVVELAD